MSCTQIQGLPRKHVHLKPRPTLVVARSWNREKKESVTVAVSQIVTRVNADEKRSQLSTSRAPNVERKVEDIIEGLLPKGKTI